MEIIDESSPTKENLWSYLADFLEIIDESSPTKGNFCPYPENFLENSGHL